MKSVLVIRGSVVLDLPNGHCVAFGPADPIKSKEHLEALGPARIADLISQGVFAEDWENPIIGGIKRELAAIIREPLTDAEKESLALKREEIRADHASIKHNTEAQLRADNLHEFLGTTKTAARL